MKVQQAFESIVVYLGPSANASLVKTLLPGAVLRPPARRGDLYRDRFLFYSVFIIIDGVFFQDYGLPLREIIDVIEDGAIVYGGASLGALRAAELWPIGMRGSGIIFRLYRRGVLVSDDEVAVSFDSTTCHPSLSVALIDIRWALHRALKAGKINKKFSETVIQYAASLYFMDRTWAAICKDIFMEPIISEYLVNNSNLKELDSKRLLASVSYLAQHKPESFVRDRQKAHHFPERQLIREALPSPSDTFDWCNQLENLKTWVIYYGEADAQILPLLSTIRCCDDHPHTSFFSDQLHKSADLQAVLIKYMAWQQALQQSKQDGMIPKSIHYISAEYRLVMSHKANDWISLLQSPNLSASLLKAFKRDYAYVLAFKESRFSPLHSSSP
jgi:hypothetical protein